MSKPLLIEQESIQKRIEISYENFFNDREKNLISCRTRLESLNNLWVRYENNYFAILNIANSSKLNYIKDDIFSKVEQTYLTNKSLFNEFIASKESHHPINNQNHNSTFHGESFARSDDSERLPRIPLPKFNDK